MTGDEQERFFSGRRLAVLTTSNPDGSALQTPLWYLYREGLFYMRTGETSAKAKNIRRDPRVGLCIQEEYPPYRCVLVKGTASILPDQRGLAQDMARHYLGMIGGFFYTRLNQGQSIEESREIILVVRPERFRTWDYSSDMPLVGRLWMRLKRFLPPPL